MVVANLMVFVCWMKHVPDKNLYADRLVYSLSKPKD